MARETRARITSPRTKPATSVTKRNGNGQAQQELESAIRARAYELYEQRGRQDGFDQEDWFQAEAEVLGQNHRRTA